MVSRGSVTALCVAFLIGCADEEPAPQEKLATPELPEIPEQSQPKETVAAPDWLGDPSLPVCVPKAGERSRIYDPSVGEAGPWYYNDHSFIRGRDGTWHVFAITHAWPRAPDFERELGHATSPSLTAAPWQKQPAPLAVDESLGERVLWAPYVLEHAGTYFMFYCAGGEPERHRMRLATSSDLYTWTRSPEPLFEDGAYARDPFVIRIGERWVMYYTATSDPAGGAYVAAYRTSDDLLHWGPREIAFTDTERGTFGGPTESPFVVRRPEGYYLFLSMRGGYDATEAFFSRDPFHFELDPLTALAAHAAEVVQDDGAWHLSHCGWDAGGLYLAPLQWSCE
ncbi:MAG TPA: family 43 glycosylhydrolase [Polyangiales bacterium]|nr:family 43 glycosylhydrolase [Polyangiales bacterium]